ncbi:uncharacterized protein LOC133954119 isoform X3 [Platichthys flesus]|uniref:uncharacterized protein LOC133954119 isoform X3 n=1 Tax=Platichthys flesus TaxID=8260 RepID=UPI002DB96A3D|nr:uncharacterized protein LOC133954119 isoform X3 [Platichthys flesus]
MEEVDITTTCESVALHSFRCLAARTRTPDEFKVSQGDATEKLAHQVAAPVAAAHRRVEEASGDTDEEEKDEAHKSSKGHKNSDDLGCFLQNLQSNAPLHLSPPQGRASP